MNFNDVRKAFRMTDRGVVWEIREHYRIPGMYINITSRNEGMACYIVHISNLSPVFEITTGVRQGC